MAESLEKTFKAKWDIGYPKFEKLFNMSSTDLQEKLSACNFPGGISEELRKKSFTVKKIIQDDVPWKIELWFYDNIKITPFGIQYCPEHGRVTNIVDFSLDF